MARIPQSELERLKREVSIARLAEVRGIELKRSGDSLVCLCPFHEDSEPSFRVDPKRNVFHCFGCGAKGSVIDFVMLLEGVSFRHAVEMLLGDYPSVPAGRSRLAPKRSSAQKLPELLDPESDDDQMRTDVAMYYHHVLLEKSPEGIDYLKKRGLDPEEVASRFRLGFSNRSLGYHVPHSQRQTGRLVRSRLQELGIMKKTGHELMRGSVVVPIFNGHGQVVQMYGRKISDHLRKGTPTHLYLPGPLRGVWNIEALAESKEIILCEALIDALTFASAGFLNVTSSYGKNGFTTEHFEAFKAYGTERVLIAYDRDEESNQSAEELAGRLGAEGVSCFRVHFPHGMDANEYACKVTPAAQSLAVLLRCAEYRSGPLKTLAVIPPAPATAWSQPSTAPNPAPAPAGETAESLSAPATSVPENPMKSRQTTETAAALPLTACPEQENPSKAKEIPVSPATLSPKAPVSPGESAPVTGPQPAPASPVAPALAVDVPALVREHEIEITLGDRRYRVRGMAKNMSLEQLRINLMVTQGERFHVDNLNLYSARQRGIFLKQTAEELQVKQEALKRDVGKVLLKLEQLQEEQIRKALEPKEEVVVLNEKESSEALGLLKDPKLLERVSADLEMSGLVGEHTNKLVCYLAAVSRKLDKPLGVLIQSSSAAGKSALMDAVLAFMPEEERVQYSAMTGQSLFYMGETNLKNKVLAISEEEGAERASYSLKLLQSQGELTIASTGKEPSTGRLTTHEYHVEGPSAIMLTTTAIDMDEELQNRCIVLAVDESREQTMAIHQRQREDRTLEGLARRLARGGLSKLHQNAQRLLRPLYVVNSYGKGLTFSVNTTRTRRDHMKYLILIESITLLHQYQREVRNGVFHGRRADYIEVTLDDIEVANGLANEALGRTLDELPPQTRLLLFLITDMVTEACQRLKVDRKHFHFTRRQVREHTGWGNTQLKIHLRRLADMEYVLIHNGGRGQRFVYELVYDGEGKDGKPFVLGLINVEKLRRQAEKHVYDGNRSGSEARRSGQKGKRSAPGRPPVGGWPGVGRDDANAQENEDKSDSGTRSPKKTHRGIQQKPVIIAVDESYTGCSEEPETEQQEADEEHQVRRKRSENDR